MVFDFSVFLLLLVWPLEAYVAGGYPGIALFVANVEEIRVDADGGSASGTGVSVDALGSAR